jgi:AcrR family transcriptional regulator
VLKHDGVDAVTTNRIAEVAGVSIGSVYQYFPDKRAIFVVLHQRHLDEIDRMVERKLIEHAASPLDILVRVMVEAMVEAHTRDPELYELLLTEVPHRAEGTRDFSVRLHGAFRLAIAARAQELRTRRDLDLTVFIVTHMVEALAHGAVLQRPAGVSRRKKLCRQSWPICFVDAGETVWRRPSPAHRSSAGRPAPRIPLSCPHKPRGVARQCVSAGLTRLCASPLSGIDEGLGKSAAAPSALCTRGEAI